MKKVMMILMIAIGVSSIAFGQTKMSKGTNKSVEAQIIAMEKQAWQEWKNNNRAFVQNYLSDDAFFVYGDGVIDKTQILGLVGSCEIRSLSPNNFKFRMLDKNAALLTYTMTQDVTCGGKIQPATIRSTSVYVKRGGKWLSTFYTEIPVAQ